MTLLAFIHIHYIFLKYKDTSAEYSLIVLVIYSTTFIDKEQKAQLYKKTKKI